MRFAAFLLFVAFAAALAYAPDGCTEGPFTRRRMAPSTDADLTITVEEEWLVDWANQALGMDAWYSGSTVSIIFSSRSEMQLNSLDPSTGGSAGTADLDPANTNCFGVVWNDNLTTPIWHTNDWVQSVLYYT